MSRVYSSLERVYIDVERGPPPDNRDFLARAHDQGAKVRLEALNNRSLSLSLAETRSVQPINYARVCVCSWCPLFRYHYALQQFVRLSAAVL